MVKSCLACVDDYRNGRLTKIEALVEIISTVAGVVANTPGRRIATVAEQYATMLDSWDSEKARASGKSASRSLLEGNRSREGRTERGELAQKRTKLDFSFLGKSEQLKPLSVNLERTNEILANWSQDKKEVLRRLMYHSFVPEFHESGWAEIIAGRCIDLDIVHTIIATSRVVEKHTETIGELEICYGTEAMEITTESEWIAAWNRAARALRFAFPHRTAELDAYLEYISSRLKKPPMDKSFCLIRQSGTESDHHADTNSATSTPSKTYIVLFSTLCSSRFVCNKCDRVPRVWSWCWLGDPVCPKYMRQKSTKRSEV